MVVGIAMREWRRGAFVAGLALALAESAFVHATGPPLDAAALLARMALSCVAVALPLLFVPIVAFRLRDAYPALVWAGVAALLLAPIVLRVRPPGWPLSAVAGSLVLCCVAAWLGRALARPEHEVGLLAAWGVTAISVGAAEALLRDTGEPVQISAWAALAIALVIVLELLRRAFALQADAPPPLGLALLVLLAGVGLSGAWPALAGEGEARSEATAPIEGRRSVSSAGARARTRIGLRRRGGWSIDG